MPIRNFGVITGAGARCAAPDDRGWRDLGMLGMQTAFWLDGRGGEEAMRVAGLGIRAVVCPEEPLIVEANGRDAVNHALLQRLTSEMIRHGHAGRASLICCADGSRLTGLLALSYQLAMGASLEEALLDHALYAEAAGSQGSPYYTLVREWASAMVLARAPAGDPQ